MENAPNKQRKRNLKWGTFTKYRIEQGYRVKWKEEKPGSFSPPFFHFVFSQGRGRVMMYKREGRNKTRKKMEGNLGASIIYSTVGVKAQLEKYLEVL